MPIDEDYLDDIAAAFAQVVDSKSPYTSGHSERVTLFTDMIAEQLEFGAEQRRWLKRAALLHDIGKLGVSNAILDKPGKLDDAEWEIMRMHSAHSEAILSRIGAFSELAPIAGAHHERLDGKGYPRGLRETRSAWKPELSPPQISSMRSPPSVPIAPRCRSQKRWRSCPEWSAPRSTRTVLQRSPARLAASTRRWPPDWYARSWLNVA